jgi:hypothetical protein
VLTRFCRGGDARWDDPDDHGERGGRNAEGMGRGFLNGLELELKA